MTCDVCGKELKDSYHYVISVGDDPETTVRTCFRQVCGRKAFTLTELRLHQANYRKYREAWYEKYTANNLRLVRPPPVL